MIKIGILTISDRCYNEKAKDESQDALLEEIYKNNIFREHTVICTACVPDEIEDIKSRLHEFCHDDKLDLILTTGGTGISPRDVTPEAVKEVIDRELPGMNLKMLMESLKITDMAMLSRPVCGVVGKTIIVTVPGSRKAAVECLRIVAPAIPHALELLQDRKIDVEKTHEIVQNKATKSKAIMNPVADRPRKSPYPMILVREAKSLVFKETFLCETKQLEICEALGFALAENVCSKTDLPPFDASIKDGYAVAVTAADFCEKRSVIGSSCAGTNLSVDIDKSAIPKLDSQNCFRINTGAPIPDSANAVVQVEDTKLIQKRDGEEIFIKILKKPVKGQDIRPKGSDIAIGQQLFGKQHVLKPADQGVLASAGVSSVLVYSKPVVAVLSTGNELQQPGSLLTAGKIYDSNKIALINILKENCIPFYDAGIARDDPDSLKGCIEEAFEAADILVSSGGVSMGEKDLLKPVLEADFGAKIHFAQVFMKPGKPTTFATCTYKNCKKLVFGLPGNPVSSVVTSNLYLLPTCRKMSGYQIYENRIFSVKLAEDIALDSRPEYRRITLEWLPESFAKLHTQGVEKCEDVLDHIKCEQGEEKCEEKKRKNEYINKEDVIIPFATSTGNQISSRLLSLHKAEALLILPAKSEATVANGAYEKGSIVNAMLI